MYQLYKCNYKSGDDRKSYSHELRKKDGNLRDIIIRCCGFTDFQTWVIYWGSLFCSFFYFNVIICINQQGMDYIIDCICHHQIKNLVPVNHQIQNFNNNKLSIIIIMMQKKYRISCMIHTFACAYFRAKCESEILK